MQVTLHATRRTPHDASRLVQAMSTWSVKTRRAPFRLCGDARVYGHTTTVIHDMSTRPPPGRTSRCDVRGVASSVPLPVLEGHAMSMGISPARFQHSHPTDDTRRPGNPARPAPLEKCSFAHTPRLRPPFPILLDQRCPCAYGDRMRASSVNSPLPYAYPLLRRGKLASFYVISGACDCPRGVHPSGFMGSYWVQLTTPPTMVLPALRPCYPSNSLLYGSFQYLRSLSRP